MLNLLNQWFPNVMSRLPEFFDAFVQTIIMVTVAGLISFVLALILGVAVTITKPGGLHPNKIVFNVIDKLINLFRSIPFIILAASLVPVTRFIMGTAIGTKGALFPLVIGITPFFARQIQSALAGIDSGLIEAAQAMGMGLPEIIWRVYLREAIPSIIRVSVITLVSLIDMTAVVGVVGGGGLGDFAIRYGYQRYMMDVTIATIIVLVLLVGLVELIGRLLVEITEP
ncbi:ABC transporter permease [Bifidobacterium sp. ESL0682]|uniref:methionine ABC transporter permease n=1 Tax=Bifidobacterium sp. ESL0682 TaxID=2983212 RepID=UPI0023F942EE|nr:methionine ABC transporter permease [Bifidobacterium sp. ESL0682]WEV41464.1 ABC transporter permease [Bifidobacterium sp. ESL0682]